tara:strand:- start:869 stop:1054 length:186 start_codon:yes stop_codon:yes gene_type:complete
MKKGKRYILFLTEAEIGEIQGALINEKIIAEEQKLRGLGPLKRALKKVLDIRSEGIKEVYL